MQPGSAGLSPRRSAFAVLALVWGALLLLVGTVPSVPTHEGASPTVTVVMDRGPYQGAGTRSSVLRSDTRPKAVAHGAMATAPHEARLPGHPAHPPAVPTAAPATASVPLVGRIAGSPSQERAPPHSTHDPRTSRGPPRPPLDV
ncbi:hypothetical protein ABZY93_30480 [Streptomyces smyrnaeus]|uniref:hypothetical protein n=1 Tax=Streptomyces smyrnaeus TaxID=1387713 RepID=UPI0033BA075F